MDTTGDVDKKISDVIQRFHRHLAYLLKTIAAIMPNHPDVEYLRKLVSLARNEDPCLVIDRCIDKYWDNREHIMAENTDFFLRCPMNKYVKVDSNKEFIDRLIRIIRIKFFELSDDEKKSIWSCNQNMLKCVIEYKLLRRDHK
jgi:hypothetical protein